MPVRLTPSLQRYAWGDPRFIPELLGLAPDGDPVAEAWFGTHPVAPATAHVGDEAVPLDRVVGDLPYLLKLLAAARPLSIQVHPNRAQAEAGFEREQRAGVPVDAPNRCYRDRNHKPELLVALTPFDALCGFRTPDEIAATLDDLPELRRLLPADDDLRALLAAYFALSDDRVRPALAATLDRCAAQDARAPLTADDPRYWALRAHRLLSADGVPDRGLLFVFLLALLRLEPGQGMFLDAGVPHAYLGGAGVELMASSDNVLRAGLTSKHVDPPELLRVVRFDAGRPRLLDPIERAPGEAVYTTPADEFELRRLTLTSGAPMRVTASDTETLLALPEAPETTVHVAGSGAALVLRRGEACALEPGADVALTATANATIYRICTPVAPDDRSPAREYRS